MNTFTKSHWVTDGNSMRLSMPFAKVDQENRLVSGFATLDNVDSQGDVVLAEASKNAFAAARGNIREMHQPIAAGKVIDFKEEELFNDGEFYRGIYVTAYVSKGAESTWEKVLDGTLTGFSIGGNITEASNEFVKEQNKSVRFIKSYDLVELSLVDNPANQLANVFSITKSADGHVMVKGMAVETEIENVFYCSSDEIFKSVAAESAACAVCRNDMQNIGWVEASQDRTEKVRDVVTKFLGSSAANNEGEGGVDMTDIKKSANEGETVNPDAVDAGTEDVATATVDDQAENVDEVTEAEEAKADAVDETPDAEEEITKKIDALKDAVHDSLEKTRTETSEAVAALEKRIIDSGVEFLSKVSELEKKFSEFGEGLEAAKARTAELEKALDTVNAEGSFKKSGDVGNDAQPVNVQKSNAWNGAFSVSNLTK